MFYTVDEGQRACAYFNRHKAFDKTQYSFMLTVGEGLRKDSEVKRVYSSCTGPEFSSCIHPGQQTLTCNSW